MSAYDYKGIKHIIIDINFKRRRASMKTLLILMLCLVELHAVNLNTLYGKWYSTEQTSNQGTVTIEKEYLTLNADRTFSILVLVSVQKGTAFIRDLRIEGSGIWKVWQDKLVIVVKDVQVPKAGEIYRISQASLRNLAENFKNKFVNEPIRISVIQSMDNRNLTTSNEQGKITHYKR